MKNYSSAHFKILFIVLLLTSCVAKNSKEDIPSIVHRAVEDNSSVYYGNFSAYPKDLRLFPIGVFDSGTGGLTVMETMITCDQYNNETGEAGTDGIKDFQGENFYYLGDHSNMPYGNYAAENKSDYLRELIIKDVLFLMGRRYYKLDDRATPTGEKLPVKILVIACNTATAYGLKDIETFLNLTGTGVKVVGVINAGVKATFNTLPLEGDYAVGVLATPGTIASNAYERTIHQMKEELGYGGEIVVVNQAGRGFAESVDGEKDFVNPVLTEVREGYRGPEIGETNDDIRLDMLDIYNFDNTPSALLLKRDRNGIEEIQLNSAANYARFHLVSLINKYKESGNTLPLKSIILGCTHYPYLLDTLVKVVDEMRNFEQDGIFPYREVIAEDLEFIDPALFTAMECYQLLNKESILAKREQDISLDPFISIPAYNLDPSYLDSDGSLTYEFKYGRECGTEEITNIVVPFSRDNIAPEVLLNLERLIPNTYNLIKKRIDK